MVKEFGITGMTCGSCIKKVKEGLNEFSQIEASEIQLKAPQVKLSFEESINLKEINKVLSKWGNYEISEEISEPELSPLPIIKSNIKNKESFLVTYKPLLLIVGFIAGVTFLVQYPFVDFSIMIWMRHFMAGFFIVFGFFKLLNLRGFASSYQMYDIVAAKWKGWGLIYPFIEVALGISYLLNLAPFSTNLLTVIILGISSIGVIQSNLNKKEIKCACLGDVFNLPMSTVTIIEDLSMVLMAFIMLIK